MFEPLFKKYIAVCLLLCVAAVCTGSTAFPAESASVTEQSGGSSDAYPKEISIRQAASKKVNGAYILDVRESHEFVQGHIPGAVMIPLSQLKDRLGELPPDREIVVVCLSGGRSKVGLDIIRQAGFAKSSSMTGGMTAWKAAEYPTVTGR